MAIIIPAKYLPFIEQAIARAADEVRLDDFFRADSDERIQRLASVPDESMNADATGFVSVALVVQQHATVLQAAA